MTAFDLNALDNNKYRMMDFDIEKSIEILQKTPATIQSLVGGLSEEWLKGNEGENTWSPYDIVGHLIHGEKTDWMIRAKIILSDAADKTFKPFDRFAQVNASQGKTMEELVEEFSQRRAENLQELKSLQINDSMLAQQGRHPALGEVNLRQLLSTWVVHDLGHISQISRVMAKQYQHEVGPWKEYLGILKK